MSLFEIQSTVTRHSLMHKSKAELVYDYLNLLGTWLKTSDCLPDPGAPVLIVKNGLVHVGELRIEPPGVCYWCDPNRPPQDVDWPWDEVTHWKPLPAAPQSEKTQEQ